MKKTTARIATRAGVPPGKVLFEIVSSPKCSPATPRGDRERRQGPGRRAHSGWQGFGHEGEVLHRSQRPLRGVVGGNPGRLVDGIEDSRALEVF